MSKLHDISSIDIEDSHVSNSLYIPKSRASRYSRNTSVLSKVNSWRKKPRRSKTPNRRDCLRQQLISAKIESFEDVIKNLKGANGSQARDSVMVGYYEDRFY